MDIVISECSYFVPFCGFYLQYIYLQHRTLHLAMYIAMHTISWIIIRKYLFFTIIYLNFATHILMLLIVSFPHISTMLLLCLHQLHGSGFPCFIRTTTFTNVPCVIKGRVGPLPIQCVCALCCQCERLEKCYEHILFIQLKNSQDNYIIIYLWFDFIIEDMKNEELASIQSVVCSILKYSKIKNKKK